MFGGASLLLRPSDGRTEILLALSALSGVLSANTLLPSVQLER
jgi:hypothetical protein